MEIKFGLGFPTCREGTAYPVPYVRPEEFVEIAQRAEELGFYALWGNDHLTTPVAISATQPEPPNFYEPLITYASLASVTRRIRFMLGVIVLPEREIILLAKQLATLDQLSGGRVLLGVGIGSYREEFEAVHPELKGANRGRMLEEGIGALRLLFTERRATFSGRYVKFEDVELAPKPFQQPFPMLLNAHADVALERVGALADGWLVAGLPLEGTAEARGVVDAAARRAGRDPQSIGLHFQTWLSFGKDRDAALAKLKRSQHWRRTLALRPHLGESAHLQQFAMGNLLGTPNEVIQQIRSLEDRTRLEHLGVVMLGDNTRELIEDMHLFAREVMPAFSSARAII
ncbi:MAG TPA: LLM class flavin-dependent oxidoreductase [Chloroflexota bacterium]